MTRDHRRLIVAGIVAGCVTLVLGILLLLPPRPRLKDEADRITPGMTLDQVTAILDPSQVNSVKTRDVGGVAIGVAHGWNGENPDEMVTIIINDADSRVVQISFMTPQSPSTESIPDKLRRWLHLL